MVGSNNFAASGRHKGREQTKSRSECDHDDGKNAMVKRATAVGGRIIARGPGANPRSPASGGGRRSAPLCGVVFPGAADVARLRWSVGTIVRDGNDHGDDGDVEEHGGVRGDGGTVDAIGIVVSCREVWSGTSLEREEAGDQ